MNDVDLAKEVLVKGQKEIIRELALCGQNGGVGRSQNYAPILVSITNAIKILEDMGAGEQAKAEFGERMKAARAAKKAEVVKE